MGLPPDDAVVSDALRSVKMFFDVAERLLHHKDYMAGNDFTLIDIYYIPLIQRLFACGYGDIIVSREAVSAWWDRCVNRPAIQRMLAADKEAAVAASRENKKLAFCPLPSPIGDYSTKNQKIPS